LKTDFGFPNLFGTVLDKTFLQEFCLGKSVANRFEGKVYFGKGFSS